VAGMITDTCTADDHIILDEFSLTRKFGGAEEALK